jgi:hypothetical protein
MLWPQTGYLAVQKNTINALVSQRQPKEKAKKKKNQIYQIPVDGSCLE